MYTIIEIWYVSCGTLTISSGWDGVVIIGVASWYILAVKYGEFLFWKRAQFKQVKLLKLMPEKENSIAENKTN